MLLKEYQDYLNNLRICDNSSPCGSNLEHGLLVYTDSLFIIIVDRVKINYMDKINFEIVKMVSFFDNASIFFTTDQETLVTYDSIYKVYLGIVYLTTHPFIISLGNLNRNI